MRINGEPVPDYWGYVVLEFQSDDGHVGSSTAHSQARELEELRDDLLNQLDEHEASDDPLEQDDFFEPEDLEGLPEDRMLDRPYTHKLVALFAISCGIMEKQLEVLNSLETIPDILDDLDYHPYHRIEPDDLIDPYFRGRGLYDNLEFAQASKIVGQGLYSDVSDVRTTRNKLVHEPTFRFWIESYDSHRQRIQKAVSSPGEINELLSNSVS